MKLGEIGENRLVEQLLRGRATRRDVIAGPGDDCAVVDLMADRLVLLKTDCVVENVHFLPNEKPAAVGWKAMMRTLSDFAAMSGRPHYALVTLISPADRDANWITQLYRGLLRAANRFDVAIVGGETSATKGPLVVSISAVGSVEKNRWVRRSGGKAGDVLFVTGKLGGSGKGGHLKFVPRIDEIENALEPNVSYGVMWNGESMEVLHYMAAISVSKSERVPDGLSSLTLAAGKYASFRYPLSGLAQGFGEIFNRLLPSSGFVQTRAPFFERYDEAFDPGNAQSLVEICLPVTPRN